MFRLLGRAPRLSARSLRRIERWEEARGARLPAAVREWYAVAGVEELTAGLLPGNRLRPLAEFLASFAGAAAGQGADGVAFFEPWTSNTRIVAYLRPDGTDDPPVSLSAEEGEMPFSAFIADAAWESVTLGRPHLFAAGNSAQDYPAECGPPQLDFLTEEFAGLTRGGEHRPFRFFRPGAWVAVYARGDPAEGTSPAKYFLWADSEERLLDLYQSVWPCHGVPASLYSRDAARRRDLLARFRARFPRAEVAG